MEVSFYWQLLKRRLPIIIIFTFVGAMLGIFFALTLPTVYNSRAVMIVETAQIPDELASSTVQTGEKEAIQIISQRIMSRDVLLELANDLGIYKDNPNIGADGKVADMRQRISIVTEGGQRNRFGPRDATVVTVRFGSGDPVLSSDTVNELVTLMLQTNLEMRTAVARQTLDFFNQEVERYESELSQLSARLLEFQESNIESLPDSLEFRREQQSRFEERLLELERNQINLQDRRSQLVSLYETTGTTQFDTATRQIADLPTRQLRPAEQRLAQLRAEYESQVGILSENNPRMVFLRSQIETTEQRVAELPALQDDTSFADAAKDQAASLYEIQLADIDAQIAYIDDQREATRAQIVSLNKTIEATPGNAVTLAALERSYAAVQAQYNQAIASKARAETGSIIESMSRGQRISVIEQAVPPERPSSPNRPLVSAAGVAAGFCLALAIVLVLELLNNTLRRPEDIKKQLGIEPFATIPYIMTPNEVINRMFRSLILAVVITAALGGVAWYVDQNVTPLLPLFERVLNAASLI